MLRAPKRRHSEVETLDQPKERYSSAAQQERLPHAGKKRRRSEAEKKHTTTQKNLKRASTASFSSARNEYQSMSRSSDDEAGSVKSLSPTQSTSLKLKAGLRSRSVISRFHIFDL